MPKSGRLRVERRARARVASCLGVALVAACAGAQAQVLQLARPGDVRLHLEVHPVCGLGVVGEPVMVVAWLQNLTDKDVRVSFRGALTPIWLSDAVGRPVVPRPRPPDPTPGGGVFELVKVPAGGASRESVSLLDTVSTPAAPATYTVRALVWDWQRLGRYPGDGSDRNEMVLAEAAVEYSPRPLAPGDRERLVAYLAWWAWTALSPPGFTVGPRSPADGPVEPTVERPFWPEAEGVPEAVYPEIRKHAREMLVSLRDPAVLPFLAQVVQTEHFRLDWALEAIRMIGGPEAREMLELLASSRRTFLARRAAEELEKMDAADAEDNDGR